MCAQPRTSESNCETQGHRSSRVELPNIHPSHLRIRPSFPLAACGQARASHPLRVLWSSKYYDVRRPYFSFLFLFVPSISPTPTDAGRTRTVTTRMAPRARASDTLSIYGPRFFDFSPLTDVITAPKNFFAARPECLYLSTEVSEWVSVGCVSAAPETETEGGRGREEAMRIASREYFLSRYSLRLGGGEGGGGGARSTNGPSSKRRRDALAHDRRITLIPSQSASPTLARPSPLLPIPTISALSKILAGWGWMDGPTHKKWQFFTSR